MKNNLLRSLALCIMAGFMGFSCSNNDDNGGNKLASVPEAIATYDNMSGGIIKGVMVGSTGVFKFSLKNGNDSVYCQTTFDGVTSKLLSTDLVNWTPGQAINRAKFNGLLGSTNVVVYLTCDANGGNIAVDFQIAGHIIVSTPIKETSTQLVKGYEGSYKTTKISDQSTVDEGIFNFVVINNNIYGSRYSVTHVNTAAIKGIITGTSLNIDGKLLYIDDEKISANSTDSEGTEKLVVTGKRTL